MLAAQMSEWLKGYEQLSEEKKVNVQRWIHLNKFIANTLKIPEQKWFEEYIGNAMKTPLDYSFMESTIPGFAGVDVPGQGETFSMGIDPGGFSGPKVPLRAQNNMGRLSPALQDAIASMLETGEPERLKLSPSDVAQLQKIFRGEKALAKLKRPSFRKVSVQRDLATDEMVLNVEGEGEILRMNVMEFGAVMSRQLH